MNRDGEGKFIKGHSIGFKKGYTPWNKGVSNWGILVNCNYCGKEKRIKKYQAKRSKLNFCSSKCTAMHYKWKGGVSSENTLERKSSRFKKWRELVFSRDDWTCQHCNVRGGELHPHHIKPFSTHKELRYEVDNGLTLCAKCHRKTDSWGVNISKNDKVAKQWSENIL